MNTKGYLYILNNICFNKDIYKLGRTKDLKSRLSTYNTGNLINSEYLFISKIFTNSCYAETILFFLLKKYRIKQNKEFFNITLQKAIATIQVIENLSDETIERVNNMILKDSISKHILELIESGDILTNKDWNANVFKSEDDIKDFLHQFKYNSSNNIQ